MKQILQSQRRGELWVAEVPAPACGSGGVLVGARCSVISAGTERMLLELGRKSLLGKARARPDLVRKVLDTVRARGLRATAEQVFARLDEPVPLGYSASGEVVEAGRDAAGAAAGGSRGDRRRRATPTMPSSTSCRGTCARRSPTGVSYADAAFATIGAIALQGVRQAQPLIGERVVVIGLGLIGLLTVQILKANGCAVLGVDPDGERVALATTLGADVAVSSDAETRVRGLHGRIRGGCRHHRRGYAEQPADRAGGGAVAPQGAGGCRRLGRHAGAT